MSSFVSILLAILLLGILIAIHEAGHFWAARLTGIEVREFAIGMGPKIVAWTSKKSGTKYALRWIPLGGYCAFYGEDDVTGEKQDDPRAFAKQKVWKRMLTVLMGPVMNFVLAFVVMIGFYLVTGTGIYDPYFSKIEEGSPAQVCGLQNKDIVRAINGQDMSDDDLSLFLSTISGWQEGDAPLRMTIERRSSTDSEMVEIEVTPVWDEAAGAYRIGVQVGMKLRQHLARGKWVTDTQPVSLTQAVRGSWSICTYAGGAIFNALKDLFTTGKGFEETTGPVGVVSEVSKQVREYGMEQFFWLLCLISINLGIMNLLPIPGLDGSRFLFMVYEAIRGKPVPQRKEAIVHTIGMLLLFGVMIFFTFRDVWRLFQ